MSFDKALQREFDQNVADARAMDEAVAAEAGGGGGDGTTKKKKRKPSFDRTVSAGFSVEEAMKQTARPSFPVPSSPTTLLPRFRSHTRTSVLLCVDPGLTNMAIS